MLEEKCFDEDFAFSKLLEDILRIECTVVRTDTSVVATNDDVSTAIILTTYRVQNRLAWSAVAHRLWVNSKHRAIEWVVLSH